MRYFGIAYRFIAEVTEIDAEARDKGLERRFGRFYHNPQTIL